MADTRAVVGMQYLENLKATKKALESLSDDPDVPEFIAGHARGFAHYLGEEIIQHSLRLSLKEKGFEVPDMPGWRPAAIVHDSVIMEPDPENETLHMRPDE